MENEPECLQRQVASLKQMENALRESENRYHQFLQASTDAVIVRSGELIIDANPAALKLLRANRLPDVVGKPYLDFVHPEDRVESAERLKKSMG